MSKHNELRDKINELCPELMKLEMGCEIEYRNKEYIFIGHNDPLLPNWFEAKYKYAERLAEIYDTEDFKILGKDPTLEDVLRAINEVYYGINMTNEGTTVLSDEIVEIIGIWELGTSLKDQSPEVWEAIDSILDK